MEGESTDRESEGHGELSGSSQEYIDIRANNDGESKEEQDVYPIFLRRGNECEELFPEEEDAYQRSKSDEKSLKEETEEIGSDYEDEESGGEEEEFEEEGEGEQEEVEDVDDEEWSSDELSSADPASRQVGML